MPATLDFACGKNKSATNLTDTAEWNETQGKRTPVVAWVRWSLAAAAAVIVMGARFGTLAAAALNAERGVIGPMPADEPKLVTGTGQRVGEHLENPFVGATFYRNVDYIAAVNAAADRQSGAVARQMRSVAEFPTFVWLDIKSTLLKVSQWQLQHPPPRHQPLGAPNGVFHTGLIAVHTDTGNEALLDAVLAMGEANKWKPGPKLMFPDHHIILIPYIELYRLRKAPRMIEAAAGFAAA